jgi:serine/threonine protein phosphatase 1
VTEDIVFVGDIHANLPALRGLLLAMAERPAVHVVFLGDYINKGADSAAVIEHLLDLRDEGLATLIAGNHELAFLEALVTGDLSAFLKMGGAMTIRSYVERPVGPDVYAGLVAHLPTRHFAALGEMQMEYEAAGVVARHVAGKSVDGRYEVSAHRFVGLTPEIGPAGARIDTGCGSIDGRLTALYWPSLTYIQVDSQGELVRPP